MKYKIKLLLILLLIVSCKEPSKIIDVKRCVQKTKRTSIDHIKIYQTYAFFENTLVNIGVLSNTNKQTYIDLLKALKLNNNKMLDLKNYMKNKMKLFDVLNEPAIANICADCIKEYLDNSDFEENRISDKELIKKYKNSFNTLLVEDTEKNIQLIENTPDFLFIHSSSFRLPILTIIYFRLKNIDGSGELKK